MKNRFLYGLVLLLLTLADAARAATTTWAATTYGPYKSTDGGAAWTEMSLDSLGGLTGIAGLATDPKISGVVYAAVTHGKVAKSTDFGVTWKALATLAASSPTNGSIFVDPRNSQNLYVSRKFGQGCFASN